MTALSRALELVGQLEAKGVRATVDPAIIAPPCLLLVPPNLTFDLACGQDALWRCPALAPTMQVAESSTWEELDRITTAVNELVELQAADLVAYTINGRQYPAYLLTWQEGI